METELSWPALILGLERPFSKDAISWKPVAISKNSGKALVCAYIDARNVMQRLDEIAPGEWSFRWEMVAYSPPKTCVVKGILTVFGVTREDVGETLPTDQTQEIVKAAVSDALKRAAVHFGIGRYLYEQDQQWVPYDESKRPPFQPPSAPGQGLVDKGHGTGHQGQKTGQGTGHQGQKTGQGVADKAPADRGQKPTAPDQKEPGDGKGVPSEQEQKRKEYWDGLIRVWNITDRQLSMLLNGGNPNGIMGHNALEGYTTDQVIAKLEGANVVKRIK